MSNDLVTQDANCDRSDEKPQACHEGFERARAYLAALTDDADLEHEARLYFERYASYPPDHFLETTARKTHGRREAFGDGDGWAVRLWSTLEKPHAYTLHAEHLGLPPACSDPANFYDKRNVNRWKGAIKAAFVPPLHWKLELAERVHVHITANRDAGPPHLPRGGELAKPIYDYEGWITYLAKPAARWNARNLALWLRAKRRGRLPHLKGTMGVPNRECWHRGGLPES